MVSQPTRFVLVRDEESTGKRIAMSAGPRQRREDSGRPGDWIVGLRKEIKLRDIARIQGPERLWRVRIFPRRVEVNDDVRSGLIIDQARNPPVPRRRVLSGQTASGVI